MKERKKTICEKITKIFLNVVNIIIQTILFVKQIKRHLQLIIIN